MRTKIQRLAISVLLLTFALASRASATVVMKLDVSQMTRRAKVVLQTKVLRTVSSWDEAHRRIFTFTEMQVLETWAGAHAGESLVVRTLGGTVDDIAQRVSGTPVFRAGQELVLFLREDPFDRSQYQIVGFAQGAYEVQKAAGSLPTVVSMANDLAYAHPTASGRIEIAGHAHIQTQPISLSALKAEVLSAKRVGPESPQIPSVHQAIPQPPQTPSAQQSTPKPSSAPAVQPSLEQIAPTQTQTEPTR